MTTEILEHIPLKIFSDEGNELAEEVARTIAAEIMKNNADNKHTVLGLDTGVTALDVYRELITLYEQKKVDFSNTIVFSLQEYHEIPPDHVYSNRRFIEENLLERINIKKENIHILDGTVSREEAPAYCQKYEETIKSVGGIDILILGIGGAGHLGFNEPGSAYDSRTRLVKLDHWSLVSAIPDFCDMKFIPKFALTMGVGTMREAKRILLLVTGDHKAGIIQKTVEGPLTDKVVASYLQKHPNTMVYLDQAAASKLTKVVTPWFVESVDWSQQINRARAVCHLSEFLHKPIPELETRDFLQYSLQELIKKYPIDALINEIMNLIKSKIIKADQMPKGKKVVIFSPHPDDDIISMGGTLLKLIGNGNEVHCIYMTPGTNAVFDHEVEKFMINRLNFDREFNDKDALRRDEQLFEKICAFFKQKDSSRFGMSDIPEVRIIKKLIRQGEGISTCKYAKVAGYEFLDPPLYKSGKAKKNPLTTADIDLIWDVLTRHKPDLVYAAGDLTDPNGTHRLCLRGIIAAFERYTADMHKPELWLYRGAWQEFHPADADAFVVMTQDDLMAKRDGIFRHQSQKDRPPQPGHSMKEFWQSSEERNLGTARLITSYGFPGLYALEGLKLYKK